METQKHMELSKVSNRQFRRYTGVTRFIFDLATLVVKDYQKKTKMRVGRHPNLCIEDQILMLFEYYRENRTFFHLGLSYGLSESNAFRTIVKLEDILIKSGYFRLEGKKALLWDKKLETVIVDATETPAQRPKKKAQ